MAGLSGKEDTWDEGKRKRRGVHLERAHPLQEGSGPLCHTVTVMPPLRRPKGHPALHRTAQTQHIHTICAFTKTQMDTLHLSLTSHCCCQTDNNKHRYAYTHSVCVCVCEETSVSDTFNDKL